MVFFWQKKYWFTWFVLIMADSSRATFAETPLVVCSNVVVVVVAVEVLVVVVGGVGGVTN